MSSRVCIELFAGAGGMMLGLEQAGFRTLVASEIHPDPCKTLKRNFPDIPVLQGDASKLTFSDLIAFSGSDYRPGEIDLIAGGPPCQGFSTAGLKDKTDPRNTLIGEFIRIISEARPKAFILENVTGLVTLHNGALFAHVLEMLNDLNYNTRHKILYASHYGVPQMRRRLIVIGVRDGKHPGFPSPTHTEKSSQLRLDATCNKSFTTCWDALSDLPQIDQGEVATSFNGPPVNNYQKLMRQGATELFNHQASKHKPDTIQYYSLVPPGGTALDIAPEFRKKKQGMQRWPLDGLARTITTEPTDFLHPTLHRIPTIRELARIQSFPDRYEFLGQRTTGNQMRRLGYCAQSQQVGNAVPPLLAQAIGEHILSKL
ncbi:DNA cytosine methyltransferase [Humidesulfovibrio idahonensis]